MALPPGTRLGVYQLTALLGEGGMGQVYLATDTTLGRQVAIKILPDAFALDPERLPLLFRQRRMRKSASSSSASARLSTRSHHALVTAGWTPPWHVPHGPGPRPCRPPNYFMDIPHPVAFGDVAALAVRTLQDAYEVPDPAALTYKAGAPDGTVIRFPTLGIARRPPRAGRSTRRTTAEQELLDWFARHRGREWTEDSSELILGQARHIGDL